MPNAALGSIDTTLTKIDKVPALIETVFQSTETSQKQNSKSICSVLDNDKCYEKNKGKGVRMVKGGSAILDRGSTLLDTDFMNRHVSRWKYIRWISGKSTFRQRKQ